ncbi:MAG: hypothetical protein AAF902_19155 [Chloroflexota bacterium]
MNNNPKASRFAPRSRTLILFACIILFVGLITVAMLANSLTCSAQDAAAIITQPDGSLMQDLMYRYDCIDQ